MPRQPSDDEPPRERVRCKPMDYEQGWSPTRVQVTPPHSVDDGVTLLHAGNLRQCWNSTCCFSLGWLVHVRLHFLPFCGPCRNHRAPTYSPSRRYRKITLEHYGCQELAWPTRRTYTSEWISAAPRSLPDWSTHRAKSCTRRALPCMHAARPTKPSPACAPPSTPFARPSPT